MDFRHPMPGRDAGGCGPASPRTIATLRAEPLRQCRLPPLARGRELEIFRAVLASRSRRVEKKATGREAGLTTTPAFGEVVLDGDALRPVSLAHRKPACAERCVRALRRGPGGIGANPHQAADCHGRQQGHPKPTCQSCRPHDGRFSRCRLQARQCGTHQPARPRPPSPPPASSSSNSGNSTIDVRAGPATPR